MKDFKKIMFAAVLVVILLAAAMTGCEVSNDNNSGDPSPSPSSSVSPSPSATVILLATVNFTITSSSGSPMSDVQVSIMQNGESVETGFTDLNGKVSIDVEPGEYDIILHQASSGAYRQITGETFVGGVQARNYTMEIPDR